MVATLYVVGAPAGNPEDLTRRALRILREVTLVVADDVGHAQRLLAHHAITTRLLPVEEMPPLEALAAGDVALLSSGWRPGCEGPAFDWVRAAIEQGLPVVPIPGPVESITALVLSGLPSDSFVYLGELPRPYSAHSTMLAAVAGERRTLVVLAAGPHLAALLADLHAELGERPLVVVASNASTSPGQTEVAWRGALGDAPGAFSEGAAGALPAPDRCVLVIGGAREQVIRWDEDRLRAEIQELVAQGLGAKEISRRLGPGVGPDTGWSRREIYRLAVEVTGSGPGE
jgi:16S rRNA (cytidine1402-2'-O)-methyltransferase